MVEAWIQAERGEEPISPVQTMEHQLFEPESEPVNGKWEVSLEGWLAQPPEDRFTWYRSLQRIATQPLAAAEET